MVLMVVGWFASAAISSSFTSVAKSVTRSTWKRAFRSTLDDCCDHYSWDDANQTSETVLVIKDVKVKSSTVNPFLSYVGMRVDDGCLSIGSMRICFSLGLSVDGGIFSKPWRVEVDHVCLELELEADPKFDAASQSNSADSTRTARMTAEDWLPLHRALENLQLTLHNIRVTLNSSKISGKLIGQMKRCNYVTTDVNWEAITTVAKDSVGTGTILHKVFKFEGLEIYSERISDLAHLGIESEFWDNSLSSTQNDFLDPPKQKSILILASGLYGAIKVKKKLKDDLKGRVASDFFGDAYIFHLSLASEGIPRLRISSNVFRLDWSKDINTYVLDMENTAKFSMTHELDAAVLVEINLWMLQILHAYSSVAPSAEIQLACERARRMEEHAKVRSLHRHLRAAQDIFQNKVSEIESKTKAAMDELSEVAVSERQKQQVAVDVLKRKENEALELMQRIQDQVSSGTPPNEIIRAALRGLHSISTSSGVEVSRSSLQRQPFDGGYRFGDITRSTFKLFSKKQTESKTKHVPSK
uniref:Band 7 domain-containing protein n=1 Tax=Micromonas pusilla TaxID=38833 RepID=A0A7S0NI49_MICPS|mmetsp:Transcript_11421/g.47821  ORF Transcript_11421/g.47821 Transcript_11421/m.47821 type:complete len:528 (+) Transcript_11421:347-1930(+)